MTALDIDRIASQRSEVLNVDETATIAEAALKMTENHVGSLIVATGSQAPLGILTERDILRRVVAQGRDPFSVTVEEIMSPNVIFCGPSSTIRDLQQIMAKFQIRHVPIVEDGVAIGIVTSRDVHAHELAEAKRGTQAVAQLTSGVDTA